MGAGGTFLRVLATGTLVLVMAAVPPPPDHHGPSPRVTDPEDPQCDVPDVTVVDGQPAHIAKSDETNPMTVYLHASEMFHALRYDVFTDRGTGVVWVPYSGDCMNETDGWYEALVHCERWEYTELVSCVYQVKDCRSYCILDLRTSKYITYSVTAFGHSLWRLESPPQGCRLHEMIDTEYIGPIQCHDNPFATSTPIKGASPPTTGSSLPTTGAPPEITNSKLIQ